GRCYVKRLAQQILSDDDDREARRPDVLLCAGINHSKARHVVLLAQDVGRHIGNERLASRVRNVWIHRTIDGVVGCDVDVVGIWRDHAGIHFGYIAEVFVFGTGDYVHRSVSFCFGNGLLRPRAGVYIVGLAGLGKQVERYHRKLCRRTPLKKENLVVVRNIHKRPQVTDGVLVDGSILLSAVAPFHYGHARSLPVDEFFLRLLQNYKGQHSRPCGEIIASAHSSVINLGDYHLKSLLRGSEYEGNSRKSQKLRSGF